MKRIIAALLAACLLPCAALASEARDASGVTETDGRLRGDIVGTGAEGGQLALRVDCPLPADFAPEQRAVLTTEWIVPDEAAVGEAMRATGADWRDADLERLAPAFVSGEAEPLPAGADAEGAAKRACAAAQRFLRSCGLGEGSVLHILRPEDEARLDAFNVIPDARAAYIRRVLAEWFTPRLDYTWVQLAFTLRGLTVSPCVWRGADGVSRSSVANLYIGDAGEMRTFILAYAPRETSAQGYAGALKEPLEALVELSEGFDCALASPREDERGRELPAQWPVALDIRPAYHSDDGVTFYPAWLVTLAWQDADGLTGRSWLAAVDARKP